MKKIIIVFIIAFALILSSAFVLTISLRGDKRPPNIPDDANVTINESIKEYTPIITNKINFSITRAHVEAAYPDDEIVIILRLNNSDDEGVGAAVSEIHVAGIEYLDNIETRILKYEDQLIPYYFWLIFVPANSIKEIKYHIKAKSPRIIDFSMAFANDQYGNQHESIPSTLRVLCRPDNFCNIDENHILCPEDCKAGLSDGICDAVDDGVNDNDCAYGTDPDFNPYEDYDNDQVPNAYDKCQGYPDTDSDFDGKPDNCDTCPYDKDDDFDNDGVCGDVDNCPAVYNPDQNDSNGNGIGDACDNLVSDDTEDAASCSGNCHSSWTRGADEVWSSVAADIGNCTSGGDRPGPCNPNWKGTGVVEEYNWNSNFLYNNVTLESKYEIRANGMYNVSCYNGASWQSLFGDYSTRPPYIITHNITVPSSCLISGQPLRVRHTIYGIHPMAPTFYYESRIWHYSI